MDWGYQVCPPGASYCGSKGICVASTGFKPATSALAKGALYSLSYEADVSLPVSLGPPLFSGVSGYFRTLLGCEFLRPCRTASLAAKPTEFNGGRVPLIIRFRNLIGSLICYGLGKLVEVAYP